MISHKQIKNYIINFIGIKDILFKSNWISRKQNYENSYELAGKKIERPLITNDIIFYCVPETKLENCYETMKNIRYRE